MNFNALKELERKVKQLAAAIHVDEVFLGEPSFRLTYVKDGKSHDVEEAVKLNSRADDAGHQSILNFVVEANKFLTENRLDVKKYLSAKTIH